MGALRVAVVGLGPIGLSIGELALARQDLDVVGAGDVRADMDGSDLGSWLAHPQDTGVTVRADVDGMLVDARPDVVFHSTLSSLDGILAQLEAIASLGIDVVSTCEELSFPWSANKEAATRIDDAAQRGGASVLGTGVNPGFAMDALPLMASAAAQRVDHMAVFRIQDAGVRRLPLMKKVGVGISVEEFEARRDTIGHVGLPESVSLVAAGLGWRLQKVERELNPVVAEEVGQFGEIEVEPGRVLGVHESMRGYVDGEERLTLDLKMYAGAPDPHDEVVIDGVPNIRMRTDGLHGDVCTAAVAVNAAHAVHRAQPGLLTMRDVPLVSAYVRGS